MISIVFAVPYPGMHEAVLEVFENHPNRKQLSRTIKVVQAEKLNITDLSGSIIVARGLTYRRIKTQYPNLPCVEVVVHTADVIEALLRCQRRHSPKCIALIGHYPNIPSVEIINQLIGCDVKHYVEDSVSDMHIQVEAALQAGCDAFAGGNSMCDYAASLGYHAEIVTSKPAAIRQALDEALRTYHILRDREISKIALEYGKESVFFADNSGVVNYLNPAAQQLAANLGLPERIENLPVEQALPFLASLVGESGLPSFEDELFDCNGTAITVTAKPAYIGDVQVGSVLNIDTVESIRRQEYAIRERLSEKGLRAKYTFRQILCGSEIMEQVVVKAKKCALVSSNLMLVGETGTGKELFAQSIHNHSVRKKGPFVAINCAALPEHLIESELFGYSEGAFTGARKGGKLGLIETAHGGTLFLDEVSELPLAVQGKLLRVLQEREVRRVGDDKVATVDVRVISASNRLLPEIVATGRFRRDLLYRLNILSLYIPPLRERCDDIPVLFWHHVRQYNKRLGGSVELSTQAMEMLLRHPFEGNVRELRNVAERLCVLSSGGCISADEMRESLDHGFFSQMNEPIRLENTGAFAGVEANVIQDALSRSGGNRTQAARLLDIDRSTLWRKMRRLGIN